MLTPRTSWPFVGVGDGAGLFGHHDHRGIGLFHSNPKPPMPRAEDLFRSERCVSGKCTPRTRCDRPEDHATVMDRVVREKNGFNISAWPRNPPRCPTRPLRKAGWMFDADQRPDADFRQPFAGADDDFDVLALPRAVAKSGDCRVRPTCGGFPAER